MADKSIPVAEAPQPQTNDSDPPASHVQQLDLSESVNFRDFYNEQWISHHSGGFRTVMLEGMARSESAVDAARGLLRILMTDSDHRDTAELCAVSYAPLGNRQVRALLAAVEILLETGVEELVEVRENLPRVRP